MEPHNHRINAAERAIQTFKSHFIAGLCTCDSEFPLALWPHLIQQGQKSLNMMRTSQTYPKLSAYHVLEGVHDFNKVPFAPPGLKSTIFNPSEIRGTFGPRALDTWYVGPAYNHYRCANSSPYQQAEFTPQGRRISIHNTALCQLKTHGTK